MILVWILGSTLIVSLLSLIGIATFAIKGKALERMIFLLVGFSAGALIGGAFLHLIPEGLEQSNPQKTFFYVILGFTLFFLLEKYLYWRHCHEESCQIHTFTYLNLIGDGLHNSLDGLAIAVSFMASVQLGIVTTLAVIFHEIPHELGNFAVLVYGGFSKIRALLCNLLAALMAMVGAIAGFLISSHSGINLSVFILPLTAGGFIYIASSDLIPELHKEKDTKKSISAFLSFILGILLMWLAKKLHL